MAGQSRSNPYASLSVVDSGQVTPTGTPTTFPDKPCKLAKFKAGHDNVNTVYIGKIGLSNGVSATGGMSLQPREETPWIPITNINKFGVVSAGTTSWVTWMTLN